MILKNDIGLIINNNKTVNMQFFIGYEIKTTLEVEF